MKAKLTLILGISFLASSTLALNLEALTSATGGNTQDWKRYRQSRGEHDCLIEENKNWLGIQRCAYDWECRGARQCTRGSYEKGDGWCGGDSACPEMGPLDHYDEDGDIDWNHGTSRNYEGIANYTEMKKTDPSLIIDLNGTEFDLDNLEEYAPDSMGPGWNRGPNGNGRNFKAQNKLPYKTSLDTYQQEFEQELAEGATIQQSDLMNSERMLNEVDQRSLPQESPLDDKTSDIEPGSEPDAFGRPSSKQAAADSSLLSVSEQQSGIPDVDYDE